MHKLLYTLSLLFLLGSCLPEKVENQQIDSTDIDSVGLVLKTEDSFYRIQNGTTKNTGEDYTYYYSESGGLFPSIKERIEAFSNIKKLTPIPSTSYTINPTRDTVITGPQGTSFFIEAYCFEEESGKPIDKPVSLTLQEFYSYEEMLKAGLTTMSNGSILETAGMFCLEGSGRDSAIKIRDGYSIVVSPASSIGEDFEFYTSEVLPDGEINWEVDTNAKKEPLVIVPIASKYSDLLPISEYIVAHYRLPMKSMTKLSGEIWSCNMNAYGGKLIGVGGETEENKSAEKAINLFKKIAPDFYSHFYKAGNMKALERNTGFSFKVLTRSELLFLNAETSLFKTFSDFKRTAKVYKRTGNTAAFVINRLGLYNFDRMIEVDQGPERTIAVNQKDLPNPVRTVIVLEDIRSILSTRETKDGFICEGIPEKSSGKVLVTSVKEGTYYLGIGTLSAGKSNEIKKLDRIVSFTSIDEYNKELEKIAGSIDKRKK